MCNYVLCALLNIPETSFPLKYKSRVMTGLHEEYKLCVNLRVCIYSAGTFHSLVFSLEGQAWQEPEPSHVTGMALARCILG